MKQEKFAEIYNGTIEKLKTDLDPKLITKFKFAADKRIFSTYQKERYRLKKYFMSDADENIDRHKIAACMMYAIVKVYPVYVPFKYKLKKLFNKERFSLDISYINEYIAIYTALSILDNFYNQDLEEGKLDPRRHKIYIPETFNDDDGYLFNMCIDLKFAKPTNKINILTYANIFFLMEYQHPFDNEE